MKRVLTTAAAIVFSTMLLAGIYSGNAHGAQEKSGGKPQTVCPVMKGDIDKSLYADYNGYRIYFCCKECFGEFKKNPEKYMKILKDSGVKLEKAPHGGKSEASMEDHGSHDDHSKMHKH